MAEKRMFAKSIIDSDAFLDMPLSSQSLYFHLAMRADDEGFINNAKKIQRIIGANDDDLKVLSSKKFIIPFESGVIVIKHWKIHNYIRSDRLQSTNYQEEKKLLEIKENGSYIYVTDACQSPVSQLADNCQHSIDKSSIDKSSIDKSSKGTRLSKNWIAPQQYIDFCNKERPDLNAEYIAEQFKDYWISVSGSKGVKLDWDATWRNWVRNQKAQQSTVTKFKNKSDVVTDAQFEQWLNGDSQNARLR